MADGLIMTFTDDNTLAFGTQASLKTALDARDGKRATLDSNPQMTEQMAAVDGSPVWSILDQQGTQAMMRSASLSLFGLIARSASLSAIKLPRLRAIPTDLHVTPPAPVILAAVDKKPAACVHVALVHVFKIRRGQQIARRAHDRP